MKYVSKEKLDEINVYRQEQFDKAIKDEQMDFHKIINEITQYLLTRELVLLENIKKEEKHLLSLTSNIINKCKK